MALKNETVAKTRPANTEMLLELTMYTNYNSGGTMYLKGQVYRFNHDTAMKLLQETDTGRPIWKIHRPKVKVSRPETVVDATAAQPSAETEPIHGVETTEKVVNIGSDDEIADILNRPDGVGDVTI